MPIRPLVAALVGTALLAAPAAAQQGVPFNTLVEKFEHLTPEQVAWSVVNMNETERLQLSIYGSFGSLVHLQACQYAPQIVMRFSTGPQGCAQTMQEWQQTLYLSGGDWNQATQYASTQRDSLLTSLRCGSGEIDRASCGAYAGALQTYNESSAAIGDAIVNMSECTVGETLPDGSICVPRY